MFKSPDATMVAVKDLDANKKLPATSAIAISANAKELYAKLYPNAAPIVGYFVIDANTNAPEKTWQA